MFPYREHLNSYNCLVHYSTVAPLTPRLYYTNASRSVPMAVELQWTSLVLSANAQLYCGADANPAPNYTLTYRYWSDSPSTDKVSNSSDPRTFSTAVSGIQLVSYKPPGNATAPTWAKLDATALEVNANTYANIECTAMNELGKSTAFFNVSVVGMHEDVLRKNSINFVYS